MTPEKLAFCVGGVPIEDARRIVGAFYRFDHLPQRIRNVRRSSIDAVRAAAALPELIARGIHASRIDPFVKFSFATTDGHVIETVRIPLERAGRFSVCVSSQAGCAFSCSFCATGRMGLQRNLETWEMVEQVRAVRRSLDRARRQRVHGIVFQGMGEPMANLDNVIETIRVATEPAGLAIDGRAITVCTAGIPRGIRRLGHEAPKVRLGISIASARPSVRRVLMPIDSAYPLNEVIEAAADHARLTRLAPMWAVTPIEKVNDSEEDALELARLAREFAESTGIKPRISIVPYNPIDPPGQSEFVRSSAAREYAFRKILSEAGLASHMRYSGGADVSAACGQLAGDTRKD